MTALLQPTATAAVAPSTPSRGAAAEFANVSKTYADRLFRRRTVEAVRDVSLRIHAGEVLGLVGPNRAGKTTLVKLLLSLCRATAGTVTRLGKPASDRSTLAQIGYVHENHAFPRYLSAAGLLEYYGALSLLPYEKLQERIPRLLQRFGLADRSREPIARFSKGMLQRLGMAQALINTPRLLVLDEPTEGLDLAGRQLMRDVVREVRAQGGTVLLVTHVLAEVEQLCDRVAVVVDGAVVHVGPVAELVQDPAGDRSKSLERVLKELYARPHA
jgi:ABC-2 type transport system ATP-binding protein